VFFTGTHANLLLWILVVFISFFSFSQGAVLWVYISEVFPNRVRAKAKGQSLGSFSHWFMNAVIAGVFPLKPMMFTFSYSGLMATLPANGPNIIARLLPDRTASKCAHF
jgi:predicted PurR-regulated permease PerM